MRLRLNPITRKRLNRFRSLRRAWTSFCILTAMYVGSLFANFISNDVPLFVRFEGRSYFPVMRYYPESEFTGSDRHTRPNYKQLRDTPLFTAHSEHFMIFPIHPFSPREIIPPSAMDIPDEVRVTIHREPRVGSLDFNGEGTILRATHAFGFFNETADVHLRQRSMQDLLELPEPFKTALASRFDNDSMPAIDVEARIIGSDRSVQISLGRFEPGSRPPRFMRATLREPVAPADQTVTTLIVAPGETDAEVNATLASYFSEAQRAEILANGRKRFEGAVGDSLFETPGGQMRVRYEKEVVTYPFRPTRTHPLGLDSSGRDVLAQILYALRTSMSFGLLLVISTMLIGILVGAVQGYFGGWVDITGQRLIEVWSALPFLYIIILLGSVYGRSFLLLLICYGIFNWIGISYYIRAEFLRLRPQPFVEAARVMGLRNHRIIFNHILPNALVPVITFFPFSLVSAIGALAALDYLGFGLPPTVPSWGALLAQAQEFRFAWWLVLYPSLALFVVILLGVFIGEGVRSAFDPRSESCME